MFSHLTESEISRRLANVDRDSDETFAWDTSLPSGLWGEKPRPAAVLIPMLESDNTWHVLFTVRTANLAEHSGQVAFPGGRVDPQDGTPEQTALREADEEIGLGPGDVRILGSLRKLRTITNYCVSPVVAAIPWPYSFTLARDEVSRVFTIPLEWLADPENHEIRMRELPHPYSPVPVIYFKLFEDELLWGVSAQITLNLLEALSLKE
jgi:8-oxo-dGTP pyrophosphatase MutT (NUDIX family)